MTWKRDFSCNNISCKNYKVKIDADAENNFCEPCTKQISELGLCLSCGVEPVAGDDSVLFPWLCSKCETLAKAELFGHDKARSRSSRHVVQEWIMPINRQMPGPAVTLIIVTILALLSRQTDTSSHLGAFIVTLIGIFAIWTLIATTLELSKDDQ
jgi:hypothetical protein